MNSWASVASSLSFANWFSDEESLYIGQSKAAVDPVAARKAKSLLDSPDSDISQLHIEATLPPIAFRRRGGEEPPAESLCEKSVVKAKVEYVLGVPPTSRDWRLPHAPVPSRPDYSRAQPAGARIKRSSLLELTLREEGAARTEGNVPEKRFSGAGTSLPQLVLARGPKEFAKFVTCCAMHTREFQHRDVRAVLTDYQFPGWCYGCRLLHERNGEVEDETIYDPWRDRPVRIGGGYGYIVRASVDSEDGWNHRLPKVVTTNLTGSSAPKIPELGWNATGHLPYVTSVNGRHIRLRKRQAWEEIRLPPIARSHDRGESCGADLTKTSSNPDLKKKETDIESTTQTDAANSVIEVDGHTKADEDLLSTKPLDKGKLLQQGESHFQVTESGHDSGSGWSIADKSTPSLDLACSSAEFNAGLLPALPHSISAHPAADSGCGQPTVFHPSTAEEKRTISIVSLASRSTPATDCESLASDPRQEEVGEICLPADTTAEQTREVARPKHLEAEQPRVDQRSLEASDTELEDLTAVHLAAGSPTRVPSGSPDSDAEQTQADMPAMPDVCQDGSHNTPAGAVAVTLIPDVSDVLNDTNRASPLPAASGPLQTEEHGDDHLESIQNATESAIPINFTNEDSRRVHDTAETTVEHLPSLADLLQSAVQVSSWNSDASEAKNVVIPHEQAESFLTPNVVSIPADQGHFLSTGHQAPPVLVAGKESDQTQASRRQSARMLKEAMSEPKAIQEMPTENRGIKSTPNKGQLEEILQPSPERISQPFDNLPAPKRTNRKKDALSTKPAAKPASESSGGGGKEIEAYNEVVNLTNGTALLRATGDIPQEAPRTAEPGRTNKKKKKQPVMKTMVRKKEKAPAEEGLNETSTLQQDGQNVLSQQQTQQQQSTDMSTATATQGEIKEEVDNAKEAEKPAARTAGPSKVLAPVQPRLKEAEKAAGHAQSSKQGAPTGKKKPQVPVPAEKPNFMHLLSLGTRAEEPTDDDDASAVEDAPSSPEMEFVIQREPTTPEHTPPPVESAAVQRAPTPVAPPAPDPPAKKEPLPKPPPPAVSMGPSLNVIRKRQRALKLFESRSRVVSLGQRCSEVASPTRKELLRASADPMDYLTKYCLIHTERLPYYERVFREVTSHQQPRFPPVSSTALAPADDSRAPQATSANSEPAEDKRATQRQRQLLRTAVQLPAHAPKCKEPAINIAEFHCARVSYALQQLHLRYERLMEAVEHLEAERDQAIAAAAKEAYPEILAADYKPSSGKKSKSPKFKRSPSPGTAQKTARNQLSDSAVLDRLTSAQKEKLMQSDKLIHATTVRLERMEQQCLSAELRAAELETERSEMEEWAKEIYQLDQTTNQPSAEMRQSQNLFFNKLHPFEDIEMNVEELEYALQLVNNHLVTVKEMKYIYYILDIPGSTRINLKMFSCIAALSEKVHQLDPIVRRLINKLDYEALEIKMEACKAMFFMLADRSRCNGRIDLSDLTLELAAGGLSPETVHYITGRLDLLNTGQVDYINYLMYIPLFVEIHQKIVKEPLKDPAQRRAKDGQ